MAKENHDAANGAPAVPAGHPTIEQREARGRTARDAAPRRSAGALAPATADRDAVGILIDQGTHRVAELVPIRYGRMAASPFAFYRGGAAIMAADVAGTPDTGITVQLCGDAHLMNFGAYAGPSRRLVFDLNDFDETHPGPWEWDVKRLVASITIATREMDYPKTAIEKISKAAVTGYRTRMRELAGRTELGAWYARIDVQELVEALPSSSLRSEYKGILAQAATRDQLRSMRKLTQVVDGHRQFMDEPPLLARITDTERRALVVDVAGRYQETLGRQERVLLSRYELVDVAHKVVGVGSVGLTAFVAMYLGKDAGDPLFLQLKEARASVIAPYTRHEGYQHNGERVVEGQKLMQAASDIFLGWVQGPERHFYVRQLADMKWSIDLVNASRKGVGMYAWLCGEALARAHARSGDRIAIASYLGAGDQFDDAMVEYAKAYADRNEVDYHAFLNAIASGRIQSRLG